MSDAKDEIILRGLKENNLKNIDLNIQKKQITVFTGISGSGKSSVVFDTLARESSRQMTMNYPMYVRNQMPRYERPQADLMKHLSPVVVVEQRPFAGNSRSTVGTYMDIDPLIRLLFSRIGNPPIESASDFTSHSSFGQCPTCSGLGEIVTPDVHKLVDVDKSLKEYAVQFKPLSPSGWQGRWMMTGGLFNPDIPIKDYTKENYQLFINGPPKGERVYAPFHTKNGPQPHEWDGLLPRFTRLYINRDVSKLAQTSLEDVLAMTSRTSCPTCGGSGLNPHVLACKINGDNIADYHAYELPVLIEALEKINDSVGQAIAIQVIPALKQLCDLGLGYLNLSRKMATLSGGEAQRVKIARHLGSSLNNMTYIFDEPTAGLHPEEVDLLTQMLQRIKKQHNTVIVIEHDLSVIEIADTIIEMGPSAGARGGEVIYQGRQENLEQSAAVTTLQHTIDINSDPRPIKDYFSMKHVSVNNLKDITVNIPKHVLVTLCGVSGSGKSSLMLEAFPEKYPDVIRVGQAPIGISSRSTLATYMGIMDDIRAVFARHTGEPAGLFSFNSLGACPVCNGKGITKPDVAFSDPVSVTCEACRGTRYSDKALSYVYNGKNIVEVLQLTIEEVIDFFDRPKIIHRANTLINVGLAYLTLGQITSSLSGGEVQRLKLASHLQKEGQIYILDEPSLGLHAQDNAKLFALFQRLVNHGNSVIIIEHNIDYIAASDWVIELGPGGGKHGGEVIFEGTPEMMLNADTLTAKWLRD